MSEPVEKSTAYEDFCRLPKHAVGEIVGQTTTEDLLDLIFSQFCLGK